MTDRLRVVIELDTDEMEALSNYEDIELTYQHPELGAIPVCVTRYCEAPDIDDSVKCCPGCERANQFGELCEECRREEQARYDDLNPPLDDPMARER